MAETDGGWVPMSRFSMSCNEDHEFCKVAAAEWQSALQNASGKAEEEASAACSNACADAANGAVNELLTLSLWRDRRACTAGLDLISQLWQLTTDQPHFASTLRMSGASTLALFAMEAHGECGGVALDALTILNIVMVRKSSHVIAFTLLAHFCPA